jgi:hypothetical protein
VASGTQAILSASASLISEVFSCSFGAVDLTLLAAWHRGPREGPTSSFVKGLWSRRRCNRHTPTKATDAPYSLRVGRGVAGEFPWRP